MGKHKHRRREQMDAYNMQQGMNGGYVNQQGNPMMNQMGGQMNGQMNGGMGGAMNPNMNPMMGGQQPNMGMNQPNMGMNNPIGNLFGNGNMNNILQLLSALGIGDQSQMASISQMLGGGSGGGQQPDIFSMISSLLNMGGGQQEGTAQQEAQPAGGSTIEELLSKISNEDIEELQRVINTMQQNNKGQQDDANKAEDVQVEDILSNLDFNNILNNLNDYNVDLSNVDVDSLEADAENIKTVSEDDIVDENIIKDEKELTSEEYKKLVSILIRLIDPNKIKLLQKIVNDYGKDKKE